MKNKLLLIKKNIKGYTLVELLAVIVVLVVVGSIILGILFSSLRGNNRSRAVNDIRQSGNSILQQMSKMIEYSRSFDGISTGETDMAGNLVFQTNCVVTLPPAPTPTPTPSQYYFLKITSFDGGQTIFSCTGDPNTIASGSASSPISLIDVTQIKVSSCYFSCFQKTVLSPPQIDINFTLSKNVAGIFSENQISIPFETSVVPRNVGY